MTISTQTNNQQFPYPIMAYSQHPDYFRPKNFIKAPPQIPNFLAAPASVQKNCSDSDDGDLNIRKNNDDLKWVKFGLSRQVMPPQTKEKKSSPVAEFV